MATNKGYINIPNVTGNIVITATATKVGNTNIACTGVTLNKTSLSFTSQNNQTLTATVTPSNTTDTISWSTSSSSVATVNNGVVTPKANGSCVITATCGSKSASCNVTVSLPISCTNITLNKTSLTFDKIGESQTLTTTVTPSNTTDTVTWSTSSSSVATVSNGVVTSKGNGNCTIIATCGSRTATCSVTVNEVPTITLSPSVINVSAVGGSHIINTTVSSSLAGQSITWKSSNTGVATVSSYLTTSGLVRIIGTGDATITATCGGVSATCSVKVGSGTSGGSQNVSCTGISLNKTSLTFSNSNSQSLEATVTPSNTTDTINWSSSNNNVATVNNGVVTPRNNGNCTITATCGSKSATCSVVVNMQTTGGGNTGGGGSEVPCTKISVYPTKYTFTVIEGWQIPTVTLTPSNTTDITRWSSSNTSVATVTTAGVIQPKGNGNCTITATCGSQSATISVTVNDTNVGVTLQDFTLSKSLNITSKDNYDIEIIPTPESLRGTGTARWYSSDITVLGMKHYEGTEKVEGQKTTQTLFPGRNGTSTITVEYDLGVKGRMTKTFDFTVNLTDNTPTTSIQYSNPTITMEGIKAKATKNGTTQYFDVSYEPNTGHPSYSSNIELTDAEGMKCYLALTKRGLSPFGKNGLHIDSGGWYGKGSSVSTEYPMQHSILYFNNFNMNITVKNVNNSVPSNYLNECIEIFNQTFPNLNMTVNSNSANTIELVSVDDNWLGVNSMYERTKSFENLLNRTQLVQSYGEYSSSSRLRWIGTAVHEFCHTLGAKDDASHHPTLMSYDRDRAKCYYIQPNDIAWIEYLHESTYGINLVTTQEEYELQVASLNMDELAQLSFGDQYNFEYGEYNEDDIDLIVDCQLEYVETKPLNISTGSNEVYLEYRIYNIVDEDIILGEMTNRQVKIHISQLPNLDTSNRYRLYLNTYEKTPSSLINPEQGIKKID